MISFKDWMKVEIKIGKVIEAEKVENSNKLIKLQVDLGKEKRQIVAGIAEFFKDKDLIGKEIPILVNLEPKKFMGVESHGMILAVDIDGEPVLLHPEKEVPVGSKIM